MRIASWLIACLLPVPALAASILDARYDAITDELVVDIAYRGTHGRHDFVAQWGPCSKAGDVVARLIDRDGGDAARRDFRVQERLALPPPECRPARVTLRLGRVAHATLSIPEDTRAASAYLIAAAAAASPASVSALIGARIEDRQGEPVGTLRDLAVDVTAGAVRYAVVEKPETSRRAAELRAVPLTALRPALARDRLVLDAPSGTTQADARGELIQAKAILGMPIQHPTGADYGIIEDLAVDLDTGGVLHVEVSLDAASRDAKREVPLSALRFSRAQQHAILTVRPEEPASTGRTAERPRR